MTSQTALPDSVLATIRAEFPKLKAPTASSKVYNDECVFSFDSDTGLYINLSTFQAVGRDFLHADAVRTNSRLYLHAKYDQVPKEKTNEEEKNGSQHQQTPTKLAIGVDGGFDLSPKFKITKNFQLFVFTTLPTIENEATCMGEGGGVFIPLPFLQQQMARDLPESIVHMEMTESGRGHVGFQVPEFVRTLCLDVLNHDGMTSRMQLDTWEADLDIVESKYARNLVQLSNGKKISNDPSTWRCELSGDTTNLWLNLSTGHIGGGRKFWDGSGGSGAALLHYEETGKNFPLCVKLGTITQHGADVWSYAEDEDALVKDPLLAEHLSHWGIDIMQLEKTEKTLGETELEKNLKYDWSLILEQGDKLTPLAGPGMKGLVNIGSSCYMNSVLQTLFSIPEVQEKYYSSPWAQQLISRYTPSDVPPSQDLSVQLIKLATALLSNRYTEDIVPAAEGKEDEERMPQLKMKVAPRMLKFLVGKGHREFSSCRQQDSSEYFQHLLQVLEREEFKHQHSASSFPNNTTTNGLFTFDLEERYQCDITGEVKYVRGQQTRQNILELRIPEEAYRVQESSGAEGSTEEKKEGEGEGAKRQKLNDQDVKSSSPTDDDAKASITSNAEAKATTPTLPTIPFDACLDAYFHRSQVDIRNPSLGSQLSSATKSVAFASFPKYLMVKLGRYFVDSSWTLQKIAHPVSVPEDELDLTAYLRPNAGPGERTAEGLQVGEVPMPSDQATTNTTADTASEAATIPNEDIVAQLVAMGFSENGCKRACLATGNISADVAMSWVFEHMEDADFNDPPLISDASSVSVGSPVSFNEGDVATLASFGYTIEQAQGALAATDHNMERAADWLFSHPDDLDFAVAQALGRGASGTDSTNSNTGGGVVGEAEADPLTQRGKYRLMAIISHMGRNTECGHYVAHVKKNGKWILFNDEKVAESKNTPFQLGFMYLFARNDD